MPLPPLHSLWHANAVSRHAAEHCVTSCEALGRSFFHRHALRHCAARALVVQQPSSHLCSLPNTKTGMSKLKVSELRAALKVRGLDCSGLKADLIQRLLAASQGQCGVADKEDGKPGQKQALEDAAFPAEDCLHKSSPQAMPTLLPARSQNSSPAAPHCEPSNGASPCPSHADPQQGSALDPYMDVGAPLTSPALSTIAERDAIVPAGAGPALCAGEAGGAAERAVGPAEEPAAGSGTPAMPDAAAARTGMAVTWLGTSSGAPTCQRNVSCIALRRPGGAILVDAGEGTATQLLRAGMAPAAICRLFVTHMHGDHCFGVPGLLALVDAARVGGPLADAPFHVFGPPGLHELVHAALSFTGLALRMPLVVTEWAVDPRRHREPAPVAGLPGTIAFGVQAPDYSPAAAEALRRWSEASQRRRRFDQSALHDVALVPGLRWSVACEDGLTMVAAQLQHRVPCWGYVAQEAGAPPQPNLDRIASAGARVEDVQAALVARNLLAPVAVKGGSTLPAGRLVHPLRRGRKVVLLGDTCNSAAIAEAAYGADLLSHEATFSADMAEKAHKAQHSTAAMAGAFARRIQARALVLTHFSSRYRGCAAPELGAREADVSEIKMLCREAAAAFKSRNVFAAYDFTTLDVELPQHELADPTQPGRQNFSTQDAGNFLPRRQIAVSR